MNRTDRQHSTPATPGLIPVTADGSAGDATLFERRYGINGPAQVVARQLYQLLTSARSEAPLQERVDAFERLLTWVASPAPTADLYGARDAADPRTARLVFLLAVVERERQLGEHLRSLVCGIVRDASFVTLLCSSGLPARTGFFAELAARTAALVLPEPPSDRDLSGPLWRALGEGDARAWVDALPAPLVAAVVRSLLNDEALANLELQRQRAARIVALRVSALGLSDDVRARAGEGESPFLDLAKFVSGPPEQLAPRLDACVAACERVRDHLERHGVSTDLVFRLECIAQGVQRLRALSSLSVVGDVELPGAARTPANRLLACVMADASRQRGVMPLLRRTSGQLARKIVDRSGSSGEHYITRTRRAWLGMLGSAAGGGLVTSGTTFFKFMTAAAALPIFITGGVYSFNYAASFLLMHALGFTLATKQPSMTAAVLAKALEADRADKTYDRVVVLVARIARSQLAAVIGNLGFVIPGAILLDLLHRSVRGTPFLDASAATHMAESVHPLHSGTAFYAALTGVILWLGSVGAGWLDNWVSYRRLPEAVARHAGLRRYVGARGATWLGRMIRKHAAPFAGCVTLGVLLGMVPAIAKAFGLPIDIRHVTLATGGIAFAVQSLGLDAFLAMGGAWSIAGLGVICLMNFTVSFACAIAVAMRSHDIRCREHARVILAVLKALVTTPGRFVFAPRTPTETISGKPISVHVAALAALVPVSVGDRPSPRSARSSSTRLPVHPGH